jgi:DNA-binding NtrC family response regulator
MKDIAKIKIKILIVDDNNSIHTLFNLFFKDTNLKITSAKNGEEALELLQWEDFDIIFLDLVMPKVFGLDMLKKMKDFKHNQKSKVVLMTAAEADELVDEAIQLGAIGCLKKPFEMEEVIGIIKKASTPN